ncbi:hypothetical protein H0K60_004468 [Salmonella enterica]|nr:hypothetical protein [Salmonella enterica]EFR2649712.1 hypothetical protein [Salmonella enterica]EFS1408061.1 hypothetical protein [Salmonella enterica]EHQ8162508.1 hypothetical protein [Salmonella enterica]EJZ9218161.1 hypothetical protein [Salmonella enterica]
MTKHTHVKFDVTMTATPKAERGKRFIYFEASNEAVDQQGERILASALKESKDYFLRFGNIDIDHVAMLGPRSGIPDYQCYEIGQPVDVAFRGEKTFVKARLYEGKTRLADKANEVWESMTALNPPVKWYPSVGGAVLAKSEQVYHGQNVTIIEKVRWANVGLSTRPVNDSLGVASATGIATFAKSLNAFILEDATKYQHDCERNKRYALERIEDMLHKLVLIGEGRKAQWYTFSQYREDLAAAILQKSIPSDLASWARFGRERGLNSFAARGWAESFAEMVSNLRKYQ